MHRKHNTDTEANQLSKVKKLPMTTKKDLVLYELLDAINNKKRIDVQYVRDSYPGHSKYSHKKWLIEPGYVEIVSEGSPYSRKSTLFRLTPLGKEKLKDLRPIYRSLIHGDAKQTWHEDKHKRWWAKFSELDQASRSWLTEKIGEDEVRIGTKSKKNGRVYLNFTTWNKEKRKATFNSFEMDAKCFRPTIVIDFLLKEGRITKEEWEAAIKKLQKKMIDGTPSLAKILITNYLNAREKSKAWESVPALFKVLGRVTTELIWFRGTVLREHCYQFDRWTDAIERQAAELYYTTLGALRGMTKGELKAYRVHDAIGLEDTPVNRYLAKKAADIVFEATGVRFREEGELGISTTKTNFERGTEGDSGCMLGILSHLPIPGPLALLKYQTPYFTHLQRWLIEEAQSERRDKG